MTYKCGCIVLFSVSVAVDVVEHLSTMRLCVIIRRCVFYVLRMFKFPKWPLRTDRCAHIFRSVGYVQADLVVELSDIFKHAGKDPRPTAEPKQDLRQSLPPELLKLLEQAMGDKKAVTTEAETADQKAAKAEWARTIGVLVCMHTYAYTNACMYACMHAL